MDSLKIPDLAGKVFLVTGASTGIGAAVAKALADQGASVAVHYNASEAAAREVADAIDKSGGTVFLVAGDVTRYEAVRDIVAADRRPFRQDRRADQQCRRHARPYRDAKSRTRPTTGRCSTSTPIRWSG